MIDNQEIPQKQTKPKKKRSRPTYKQTKLIKAILDPSTDTIADAGRKAGYAKSGGYIYRPPTLAMIRKVFGTDELTIEKLREKYIELHIKCLKDNDNTNAKGTLDSITRILGGFKDKLEQDTKLTVIKDDERLEINAIKSRLSGDN